MWTPSDVMGGSALGPGQDAVTSDGKGVPGVGPGRHQIRWQGEPKGWARTPSHVMAGPRGQARMPSDLK